MNLNSHFRRTLGSVNSEHAHVSREFNSSSGDVSDPHLIHLPKDENVSPSSPHENVERWIDALEPVFSSSEEELPQDDSYSCKSSVFSEDEFSLGAEAVLYQYHLEKHNSTSTSTSKDTDSLDHHHPVRRVRSEPTVRTNNRETEDKVKSSAEEKRARWRNSYKFGSHSVESASSDISTPSSVSELLNALDYDPEEVLTNLGFYEPDLRTRIPDRFFQSQSLARGISVDTFRMSIDDDHTDACTTHSGGSWSDPGCSSAIPARFERSLCKLQSSEFQQNGIRVPEICEPEEVADENFDLMRHLRLQRAQHKVRPGNLLEPVTEELEVSSTGSGSVQTRIAKKQASEDSDDMFVASLRVSQSTGQSPETMITITNAETQEDAVGLCVEMSDENSKLQGSLFSTSENSCRLSALEENNNENENDVSSAECNLFESNISSRGRVTTHRLTPEVSHLALQESFEMEEIATDEGDISKESRDEVIGKDGLMAEDQRVKFLSRNDSGDSSGFGEGLCTDGAVIPAVSTAVVEREATITIKYNCFDNDSGSNECSNITSSPRRRKLSKQKKVSDEEAEEFLGDNCSEEELKGEAHRRPRRKLGANLDLYFFNSTESNQTVKQCELEALESPPFSSTENLTPSITVETCLGSRDGCHSDCPAKNDVTFISRSIEEQSQTRQKHCLLEIDILETSIDKYQAGLDVLESISSAHEMYHTKKTLIRVLHTDRMAGDVSAIQSLRWMINEEMHKIKRLLLERKKLSKENDEESFNIAEPMNPGVTQKMAELLREQSVLQDELMRLANDVLIKKKQPNQSDIQSELDTVCQKLMEELNKSREKIEHEVRTSLIDELTQTYACEIERLQLEIQSKDDVIQQLKMKLDALT